MKPSSKTRRWARPALLAVFFVLAFGRYWGHTIAWKDSFHFFSANKFIALQGLRAGTVFGWNPWQFMGQPFAADPQSAAFYPLNLLFLVLSFGVAHRLYILLHYPLAAGAMYLFLRGRGLREPPAWLGAAVFALGGYLVSQHGPVRMLLGAAWAPLVFYFVGQAMADRPARILAAAAAMAMQVLSGDPETAFVTGALAGGWMVARGLGGMKPMGAVRAFGLAAALGVAALALAAVQVLPAAQMMSLSDRAGGLPLREALPFSLHPAALAELFWPTPFGLLWPRYYWWGRFTLDITELTDPWSLTNYVGLTALALAALALWRGGLRRALILGGLALFTALALGRHTPVYGWLHAVLPVFDSFRYPAKFMAWVTGILAVAAACGLDRAMTLAEENPRALRRVALGIGATALAVAAAGLIGWPRLLLEFTPYAAGSIRNQAALRHIVAGGAEVAAAGLAAAIVLWLTAAGRLSARAGAALIVAVVIADLWLANVRIMPTGPADLYATRSAAAVAIASADPPAPGRYRIFREELDFPPGPATEPMPDRILHFNLDTLKRNLDTLYGFEDVVGYGSYEMKTGRRLFSERLDFEVLNQFGVKYIVSRPGGSFPWSERIAADPARGFEVHRLTHAQPRAYWTGWVSGAVDEEDEVRQLKASAPAAVAVVKLPLAEGTDWPAPNSGVSAKPVPARIERYEPDRVEVMVDAPADGLLVLLDRNYPGWTATVDGVRAKIVTVNVICRGLPVRRGSHRVVFEFRQPGLRAGATASAAAWLLCAGALAWDWRRRRAA